MKQLFLSAAVIALAFTSCKKAEDKAVETSSTDTVKVETPTAETTAPAAMPTKEEMDKAWGEYMTPGDMHKLMATDVGSWKADMTMYMDPTKPTKAESTAEIKMVMGGRYQEARYKGKIDGMDFEGIASMGYNNASKKFESTWMDNMGTGIMYTTGDYDPASKSVTFKGSSVDPITKKEKAFREVFTYVDQNNRKMEMFDTDPSGKEYKSMEIALQRK